jgi:hypothetical protein
MTNHFEILSVSCNRKGLQKIRHLEYGHFIVFKNGTNITTLNSKITK